MEQWKQVTMEYSPEFFEQQFEESLAGKMADRRSILDVINKDESHVQ